MVKIKLPKGYLKKIMTEKTAAEAAQMSKVAAITRRIEVAHAKFMQSAKGTPEHEKAGDELRCHVRDAR